MTSRMTANMSNSEAMATPMANLRMEMQNSSDSEGSFRMEPETAREIKQN